MTFKVVPVASKNRSLDQRRLAAARGPVDQPDGEALERGAHALDGAAEVHANAFGEGRFLDDVIDSTGDAAEVFGFGGNVHIDDAE